MAKRRVEIIVTGLVQGVYYRARTRREAAGLGLTGWVRNRHDGSVEIVAEGDEDDLKKLVRWGRQGPPDARVDDVQASWLDYRGQFDVFTVSY